MSRLFQSGKLLPSATNCHRDELQRSDYSWVSLLGDECVRRFFSAAQLVKLVNGKFDVGLVGHFSSPI